MELIAVCVAFALALAGAALFWWLTDRAAARRELASAARAEAQEKLLLGLVDRVQSPTPQAFAARQEAAAKLELAKSLTPEDRAKAAEKLAEQDREQQINDYFDRELWRNDPALSGNASVDQDGEEVVLVWDGEMGPEMERVPRGEFLLRHVLGGPR